MGRVTVKEEKFPISQIKLMFVSKRGLYPVPCTPNSTVSVGGTLHVWKVILACFRVSYVVCSPPQYVTYVLD